MVPELDDPAGLTLENDNHAFSDLSSWNCHYLLNLSRSYLVCGAVDGRRLVIANDESSGEHGGMSSRCQVASDFTQRAEKQNEQAFTGE